MNEPEKLIPLHVGYWHLKSFQVDAGVAAIATEVTRRRTEARRLRSSAGSEWAAGESAFRAGTFGQLIINAPMANPTQLKILKKGVKAWDEWRKAHMSKAEHIDLSHEDFHGADLRGANLSQGHPFGANIYWSDFVDADLSDARLNGANLSVANLNGAKLLRADLNGVNLNFATLKRSNLSCARIGWTSFGYVDFREVTGLDTVIHDAPSSIGIETLYMSQGEIPDKFLRDAGVREEIIDIARSIRNGPPIQWHSCFISYSTKDEEFVLRLHSRMREANMRVWFAPEDLKGGKKLHEQLFEAIQMNDRLSLCFLSTASKAIG